MIKIPCNINLLDRIPVNDNGTIRNSDIYEKFFYSIEEGIYNFFRWPKKGTILNNKIYSSPSASPLAMMPSGSFGEETCFKDVFSPTPSKIFDTKNHLKWEIDKDLSFEDYRNFLYRSIDESIDRIYSSHSSIVFFYSGGIDSQVVLSFLIKKQLLERTKIAFCYNSTIPEQYQIRFNEEKLIKLKKILEWLKPRCVDIEEFEFTKKDLIQTLNEGNLVETKAFITYLMFKKYQDSALMFGMYGNTTMLHRSTFAGQIMLFDHSRQWKNFSNSDKLYTKALLSYNYKKDAVPIQDRFLAKKTYFALNGRNNNYFVSPIVSQNILNMMRRIDWRTVSLDVIAEAQVPRYFINKNVGEFLDPYITDENTADWDNLDSNLIPLQELNSDVLSIPMDIEHDIEGLTYISNQVSEAKKIGNIHLNSIVSIKNLQMISHRFKNAN